MTPEIEGLRKKLAANPQSLVFVALADALRRAGQLGEAADTCRLGLTHHPKYMSAHVVLGKVLYEKRELDAAAGEFRQVLESDPENLVGHTMLGQVLLLLGDLPSAVAELEAAQALNPDDEALLESLQDARRKLAAGAPAGESAAIEAAMKDAPVAPARPASQAPEQGAVPRDELATVTVAEIYLKQGFFQEAIEIFQKIIAADPANADATHRLRLAIRAYEEHLSGEAPPPPPVEAAPAEFGSGDILAMFKEYNGTKPASAPASASVTLDTSTPTGAMGDEPAGKPASEPAAAPTGAAVVPAPAATPEAPKDPYASQVALAELYLAQSFFDEAIEVLQRILAENPERADVRTLVEGAYHKKENVEQNPVIRPAAAGAEPAFGVEDEILSASETTIEEIGDESFSPTPTGATADRTADKVVGKSGAAERIAFEETSREDELLAEVGIAEAPRAPTPTADPDSFVEPSLAFEPATVSVTAPAFAPAFAPAYAPSSASVTLDTAPPTEATAGRLVTLDTATPTGASPAALVTLDTPTPTGATGDETAERAGRVAEWETLLHAFVEGNGVTGAVLSDLSGAVRAAVVPPGADEVRLASASAAIFAATGRVTERLQQGKLVRVSLSAPGGQIFLCGAGPCVLSVTAGEGVKIGFLRLAINELLRRLASAPVAA